MDENTEEIQWVMRFQKGDEEAFSWLFETYYPQAFRMAWLISGNYADSEDIVQETFAACYCHKTDLRNPNGFRSWFYKILTRAAWKQSRKQKRETPEELIFQICDEHETNREPQPLEVVIQKQQDARIYRAIADLPIKQRAVVVLYYFNEISTREIAQILGCMEGTVKSRLHTARKKLKMVLSEADEECEKETVKRFDGERKKAGMERGMICHEK